MGNQLFNYSLEYIKYSNIKKKLIKYNFILYFLNKCVFICIKKNFNLIIKYINRNM